MRAFCERGVAPADELERPLHISEVLCAFKTRVFVDSKMEWISDGCASVRMSLIRDLPRYRTNPERFLGWCEGVMAGMPSPNKSMDKLGNPIFHRLVQLRVEDRIEEASKASGPVAISTCPSLSVYVTKCSDGFGLVQRPYGDLLGSLGFELRSDGKTKALVAYRADEPMAAAMPMRGEEDAIGILASLVFDEGTES